jgi:hypothetical protein
MGVIATEAEALIMTDYKSRYSDRVLTCVVVIVATLNLGLVYIVLSYFVGSDFLTNIVGDNELLQLSIGAAVIIFVVLTVVRPLMFSSLFRKV